MRPASAGRAMSVPALRPAALAGATTATSADGEAARLAAVHHYEILDAPVDGTFDDIAALAATVFATPIATVSIVDADRVFLAACRGLDGVREVGIEPGLCVSAILTSGPYVVTHAGTDPRTLGHPLVRGQLGIRFYAAAPIVTGDGHALGTVNVMDFAPRQATEIQISVLTTLAGLVARHLDLRLAAIRVVDDERQRRADAYVRASAADERAQVAGRLVEKLRTAAAAQVNARRPDHCQLGGAANPCLRPTAMKVADAWGDSAWGCLAHVEEAILNVSAVFIADEDLGGLGAYMNRR